MKVEDIKTIAVIGAGNMGHQISTLCAIHGFTTYCMDMDKKILDKAVEFVAPYLASRVKKGKLTQEQVDAAKDNLVFTQDLKEAVQSADVVIEAIIEVLDVKRKVFAEMDKLAPEHTLFTTNSSYIVSSKIADATSRPDKICNMHFFNPALVMKLVEVVKGDHTSDETADLICGLSERIGKKPSLLIKEIEGFMVNRVLQLIRLEAYWLLEMGVATVEDIDRACKYGLGHPMGPFELNDLTGLDLSYIQAVERFRRTGDPKDLPYAQLALKYSEGKFGKKVGEGWYNYE